MALDGKRHSSLSHDHTCSINTRFACVLLSQGSVRPIQLSSSLSQPASPQPPLASHRSLPSSFSADLDTGLNLDVDTKRAAHQPPPSPSPSSSRVSKDYLHGSPGARRRAQEYSPRLVSSRSRTRIKHPQPDWSYVQPVVDCYLNR